MRVSFPLPTTTRARNGDEKVDCVPSTRPFASRTPRVGIRGHSPAYWPASSASVLAPSPSRARPSSSAWASLPPSTSPRPSRSARARWPSGARRAPRSKGLTSRSGTLTTTGVARRTSSPCSERHARPGRSSQARPRGALRVRQPRGPWRRSASRLRDGWLGHAGRRADAEASFDEPPGRPAPRARALPRTRGSRRFRRRERNRAPVQRPGGP